MVVQSCGISRVSLLLGLLLGHSENTVRQRLREWCYDAPDKRGGQRQQVEVQSCFGRLLHWILSKWLPGEQRLALVLDATTLRQVFTVLSVSVVYRGCAIPVAWVILPATAAGAWQPHWLSLLASLKGHVPTGWEVLVLTDRGLYAKWLYRAIQANGWHPFMRINHQGQVRPQGQTRFRCLSNLVCPGEIWAGQVASFKTPQARLSCTLLTEWDEQYTDPWLIVTDLPPQNCCVRWYGMRSWIEQGFKDCKRGGWHWEHTKMTDPPRATRLWLVMALATLWVVSVGGQAETCLPPSSLPDLPPTHIAHRTLKRPAQPRRLSCFTRGLITLLARLIQGQLPSVGLFVPQTWPLPDLLMAHHFVPI